MSGRVFWDRDTIRFMIDASENSTYNEALAEIIGPRLLPDSHVCDAGCGLGYLSLELAKRVKRVTAADKSKEALAVLRENCAARGVDNVEIRLGDIGQTPPEKPYDAMVFCLFGESDEGLYIAKQQCRGDVFMVLRNYDTHRFSVRAHRMEYMVYRDMCRHLEAMGVPYQGETHSLDLGQLFLSIEDAKIFFKRYSRDGEELITDEFLHSRLQRTGRSDFPYYMPHLRDVGVIHFLAKDLAQRYAKID